MILDRFAVPKLDQSIGVDPTTVYDGHESSGSVACSTDQSNGVIKIDKVE